MTYWINLYSFYLRSVGRTPPCRVVGEPRELESRRQQYWETKCLGMLG
jgi:hypothetical protein